MPTQFTDLHRQMFGMISGYWISQTARAFADLSVADHLTDGPLTAPEIAAREQSAADTTLRLMRAGVALGLLTVDANERFAATPLLDTLRTGAPGRCGSGHGLDRPIALVAVGCRGLGINGWATPTPTTVRRCAEPARAWRVSHH